ncbi:alkaline phosphatase family protein [bacterium]|nr:alkaline phosphatase family protein [bacterium]
MPVLAVVIAVSILAGGCSKFETDARPKVALIGLDGADWDVIDELIAAGRLPTIKRLMDGGVRANLETIEPILSPIVWTSIVTGVTPERHGITWFMVRDPKTGNPMPITSAKRDVPALWNIASRLGRSVGFVGWWASWPAETVNGFVVTDQVAWHGFGLGLNKDAASTSRTYPESIAFEIESDIVNPLLQPKSMLDPFMKISDLEYAASANRAFDFQNPLHHFMHMLATLRSYEAIGEKLYEKYQPDLFGIYFESIDTTGHLYMKYRAPRMEGISGELFDKYNDTLNAVYERNDKALARLLDKLDPNTIVIVCSDHGFKSREDRLAEAENTKVSTAHKWHEIEGVVLMSGPGVRQGVRLSETPSILDITPTVLYALDLPVAEDFDGKPILAAFEEKFVAKRPVTKLPTYDTGEIRADAPAIAPELSREMEEKLKSLGYIGGEETAAERATEFDSIETHMNRLDMFRKKGDRDGMMREARAMVGMDPGDPRAHAALGDAYATGGDTKKALESISTAETLVEKYMKDPPVDAHGRPKYPVADDHLKSVLASTRGVLHLNEKQYDAALAELTRSRELDDDNVMAWYNMALAYDRMGKIDKAFEFYHESAKRFPDHAYTLNNLGNMHFKRGETEKAIEYYERTAKADPKHHECHHNRGVALEKLGRVEEAEASFRASLERNPDFVPALARLGVALIRRERNDEALEIFEKLAVLSPDDPRVLLQLTELHYAVGHADRAHELYARLNTKSPKAAEAFRGKHPEFDPK